MPWLEHRCQEFNGASAKVSIFSPLWLTNVSHHEIQRLEPWVNPHLVCHVDKYSPVRRADGGGGNDHRKGTSRGDGRASGLYRKGGIPRLRVLFLSWTRSLSLSPSLWKERDGQYSCSTARVRKGFCKAFYPLFIGRLALTGKFSMRIEKSGGVTRPVIWDAIIEYWSSVVCFNEVLWCLSLFLRSFGRLVCWIVRSMYVQNTSVLFKVNGKSSWIYLKL